MTRGVDTTDVGLSGATLKANGYAFACRYYQYGGTNPFKELTTSEAVEKSNAGIRLVSNYETNGNPLDTIAQGEKHARAFLQQHNDVGGPDWAPCYFSIDHDVSSASAMDAYFEGCRNVLGVDRVGVYGAGGLIRHLKAVGLVKYGWLSMSTAWLGGKDTTGCDLHQTGSGTVAGHSVDFDTALSADYGGWLLGEDDPNMTTVDLTPAALEAVASQVWQELIGKSNTSAGVMLQTIYNATDNPQDGNRTALVTEIAAAVVAALPPAQSGGLTQADVEAAMVAVLNKPNYTAP